MLANKRKRVFFKAIRRTTIQRLLDEGKFTRGRHPPRWAQIAKYFSI